jgi:NAD(P)-dependent dehydrogenase (short-subunit alcohol dehydrogenase family)
MRRQQEGLLIYVSSTSSTIAYPFMGAYGASKAALEGIALTLNNEIYSLGIDTVIIQAGAYGTDFGNNLETTSREEIWEHYAGIGQAGKAMIAGLPAYFASNMATPAESLAEQIAEYMDMSSGQRPLKVGLGFGSEGIDTLNNVLLPLQTQAIEMFGFGALLKR